MTDSPRLYCPRCKTGWLRPNEDGDLACLCGHVVYAVRVASPVVASRVSVQEVPRLSPRQTETLSLVADGLANREIAERMGLTLLTVKQHLRAVKDRLGIETREELAEYAKASGGGMDG